MTLLGSHRGRQAAGVVLCLDWKKKEIFISTEKRDQVSLRKGEEGKRKIDSAPK